MNKEERLNIVVIPFVTNFLAVVLGIVITFTVQNQVDRKHEKDGIRSSLNLVQEELASNITDLQYAKADMETISSSAAYLYSHIDNINSCSDDSVEYHWKSLKAESYLTLPDDALQMLKSTYLYSSMLDREVALTIVRAYDICDALQRTINNYGEHRIGTIEKIDDFFLNNGEMVNTRKMISSAQGRKMLQTESVRTGIWITYAIPEIEEAITAISSFLGD